MISGWINIYIYDIKKTKWKKEFKK